MRRSRLLSEKPLMNTFPEITPANVNAWLGKAVQDVTETMFEQAAYPEETLVEAAGAEETVVACIGVRGDFQLEVAMSFPLRLARQLASISLEIPVADVDEKMIADVAGECSNMVVGAVKSRISDMGIDCVMTVPRIVRGLGNAPELAQKIKASFAVIRGSAGPRNEAHSVHGELLFRYGSDLLRLASHL